jgi:Ca2+-binding EF-hand superfamily protein
MLLSIAKPKFVELDVDKKGLLEVKDLVQVAASALPLYKPGGMKAADEEDTRTLIEFEETLRINNEPTTLEDLCAMLEYTSARVALRSASFRKFRELDTDNSGYLDRNELTEVVDWVLEQFSSLGLSNADEEMIRVNFINKVDSNTDGKLDEEEFAEMFEEVAMSAHLMRNARAKFTELDTDGSDSLEGPELEILCDWVVHIYYPRGVRVTDYERDLIKAKIMKNIDTNGDGCLDIQEFASLFEEITMRIELNKRAMKKFIELDKDNTGKLDVEKLEKLAGEIRRMVLCVLYSLQVLDWVLKLCAPTVDKVAIRRNFLHKLQSTPDMKLVSRMLLVFFAYVWLRRSVSTGYI